MRTESLHSRVDGTGTHTQIADNTLKSFILLNFCLARNILCCITLPYHFVIKKQPLLQP